MRSFKHYVTVFSAYLSPLSNTLSQNPYLLVLLIKNLVYFSVSVTASFTVRKNPKECFNPLSGAVDSGAWGCRGLSPLLYSNVGRARRK